MSTFSILCLEFEVNWTTILVGWRGFGARSWPDKWTEFPPLLSTQEITAYADRRLEAVINQQEVNLIVDLLSIDLGAESRESVEAHLRGLAGCGISDQLLEFRKWRLVKLEQVLDELPNDPIYGLIGISEFWQSVGFPSDSPHEEQGRGNATAPLDYYQPEMLRQTVHFHREWIKRETAEIKAQQTNESR